MESERLARNPFFILGLQPGAGRAAAEQAGQRIRAMLEMGVAGADRYLTPLGERVRDLDLVRQAMHEMQDPATRAVHEVWARLEPRSHTSTPATAQRLAPWPELVQDYPW